MAESVENRIRYANGSESWLVDRFVCATTRLEELATELHRLQPEAAIEVSAIGRPAQDRESWEAARAQDAKDLNAFGRMADSFGEVVAYEVRVPDLTEVRRYCQELSGFDDVDTFMELPWADQIGEALAEIGDTEWIQAKGRTGGPNSSDTPTPNQLASFIHECVSLELPFKLTAGLHHPLPKSGNRYGFLNVLGSTALAFANDLSRKELQRILEDASPENWFFEDGGLRWRDLEVETAAIEEARQLFLAIGSCSIEEPIRDLQSMGLV